MAATEPIRDKNQLKELAGYWLMRGNVRNYTLIVLGACTALRIGDLLRLKWEDVFDNNREAFYSHITLSEGKTGKQKAIAIHSFAIQALSLLHKSSNGGNSNGAVKNGSTNSYIFESTRTPGKPIGRVQAWRVIHEAAGALDTSNNISCHSLRKTFGYHAWMSGINPVLIMDIYNHSSYEITKRYLGVAQDDRDRVYLNLALF